MVMVTKGDLKYLWALRSFVLLAVMAMADSLPAALVLNFTGHFTAIDSFNTDPNFAFANVNLAAPLTTHVSGTVSYDPVRMQLLDDDGAGFRFYGSDDSREFFTMQGAGFNFSSTGLTIGVVEGLGFGIQAIPGEIQVDSGLPAFATSFLEIGFLTSDPSVYPSGGVPTSIDDFLPLLKWDLSDFPTTTGAYGQFFVNTPDSAIAKQLIFQIDSISAVPEPSSALLLGLGLPTLAFAQKRLKLGKILLTILQKYER